MPAPHVTQATLDDAKLTADDLCAAALQFKTLSEAGTSDEYEREYRFALAASALGNADAMLYLGEMYQGSHIEAARSSDDPVQDAVSWWNKAAESGVARGYTNIAICTRLFRAAAIASEAFLMTLQRQPNTMKREPRATI